MKRILLNVCIFGLGAAVFVLLKVVFRLSPALSIGISMFVFLLLFLMVNLPGAKKSPSLIETIQQKISRIRSLLFRCRNDNLRKKGEALSDTARKIISLLQNRPSDDMIHADLEQLSSYLDNLTGILQNYNTILESDPVRAKELDQKIIALFDSSLADFNDFYSTLQDAAVKDIRLKISIAEKTIELDQFLRNKGTADIPL